MAPVLAEFPTRLTSMRGFPRRQPARRALHRCAVQLLRARALLDQRDVGLELRLRRRVGQVDDALLSADM